MKSSLKTIALRAIIVMASAFVLAVGLAAIFEDEIGRKIIAELNTKVKTKITVGDVSLSLIRHFPKASATLKNVEVYDLNKKKLLKLSELSFSMGLWSLFSGNPEISTITLKQGLLNIEIDVNGKNNYEIFKETPATENQNQVAFTINKAVFENVAINYINQLKHSNYNCMLNNGEMRGNFTNDQYLLDLKTDWLITSIYHQQKPYLSNKALKLSGKFEINNKKGIYNIQECLLDLASNQFKIQGKLKSSFQGTDFDLYATGQDINLESISQLGIQELNTNSQFSSKGIVQVNARIDGVLNKTDNPAVLLQYSLKNGSISGKKINGSIDQISFSGSFSNGWSHNMRSASFSLENCRANINGLPFSLNLKVKNLENPDVDFTANGKIPLGKIYGFIPEIQGGSGYINFKNLIVAGKLSDMRSTEAASKVKAAGSLEFENAVLNFRGEDLKFASGNIMFANTFININQLVLRGLETDLLVQGKISNYLPYLIDPLKQDKLILDIVLNANNLNLEKWLYVLSSEPSIKTENNEETNLGAKEPFARIQGKVKVDLDQVKHKNILAKNFSGELLFEGGDLLVSGDVLAMEGDWNVEGQITYNQGYKLKATLESNKVNIKEFFRQSNNFGQSTLTENNLSGKLNAKILIFCNWDIKGNFDKSNLHVYGGLSIDNGELIKYPMMENFSKFIKIQDLRHIRFVNLRNLLEIENGIIYLPAMFIQSNAMNLTVSGQQSFNDEIDYNFKINAGQLILNKLNLLNKTTDALPAQKNGFFNLYYNIKGNINDPKNKKDKAIVKANFTRSEIRKHKIMNTLLAEFGSLPEFDEPKNWVDQGESPSEPINTPPIVTQTNLKTSLKSTLLEAKQTLKNPTKSISKPAVNTFKDEADDKEEYLDFK